VEEAGGPAVEALEEDSEVAGEEDSEVVGRREVGNGSFLPFRGRSTVGMGF
jgi:hypothetical protein